MTLEICVLFGCHAAKLNSTAHGNCLGLRRSVSHTGTDELSLYTSVEQLNIVDNYRQVSPEKQLTNNRR